MRRKNLDYLPFSGYNSAQWRTAPRPILWAQSRRGVHIVLRRIGGAQQGTLQGSHVRTGIHQRKRRMGGGFSPPARQKSWVQALIACLQMEEICYEFAKAHRRQVCRWPAQRRHDDHVRFRRDRNGGRFRRPAPAQRRRHGHGDPGHPSQRRPGGGHRSGGRGLVSGRLSKAERLCLRRIPDGQRGGGQVPPGGEGPRLRQGN